MNRYMPVIAVALAVILPTAAKADVFGTAYLNNAAASDTVIGFAHGAADATFTVPSPTNPACTGTFAGDTLCFNSYVGADGYTLGGYLASGGATVLSGSAAALASDLDSTVFEFTGTVSVTNGQTFQAGHDDGIQLMIGTTVVIDGPGPTGFNLTPSVYTGPTGTFAFDLVYGECCGGPAFLGIALPFQSADIVPDVPEPASLVLIGTGVLGTFAARRRWAKLG